MLCLWLMEPEKGSYIHSAGLIFEAEYESEWLEQQVVKDMIKDVDNSEVIDGECIKSPVLGLISPVKLSGGVKTLMLARNDDSRMYNLTSCGDNCVKWVLKLAEDKDITMRLGHFMQFGECEPFNIKILNSGVVIHTQKEFIEEMSKAIALYDERNSLDEG